MTYYDEITKSQLDSITESKYVLQLNSDLFNVWTGVDIPTPPTPQPNIQGYLAASVGYLGMVNILASGIQSEYSLYSDAISNCRWADGMAIMMYVATNNPTALTSTQIAQLEVFMAEFNIPSS